MKNPSYDLALFELRGLDETNITEQLCVVGNDIYKINMLTTQIQVYNNSLFEFAYLFDVWVNQLNINFQINYHLLRFGYAHLQ